MQLSVSDEVRSRAATGQLSQSELERFERFVETCNDDLMRHSVITDNHYTRWFDRGEFSRENLIHFIVQFSVFSNLFVVAQLLKTINASTLEGMRASKEILANELGVIYTKPGGAASNAASSAAVTDTDRDGDPDLVTTEGSIEGGIFRFRAAHFEWLLRIGAVLGLGFDDMGKRRHGAPATLFFCDELARIYGSEDGNIAAGASFAVENWAAAGFWKELITGLRSFKKAHEPELPLAFFTWHDKIEDQHAGHVMDELEEIFFAPDFDSEKFLAGGREMLNGVEAFWVGLNENRIAVNLGRGAEVMGAS